MGTQKKEKEKEKEKKKKKKQKNREELFDWIDPQNMVDLFKGMGSDSEDEQQSYAVLDLIPGMKIKIRSKTTEEQEQEKEQEQEQEQQKEESSSNSSSSPSLQRERIQEVAECLIFGMLMKDMNKRNGGIENCKDLAGGAEMLVLYELKSRILGGPSLEELMYNGEHDREQTQEQTQVEAQAQEHDQEHDKEQE